MSWEFGGSLPLSLLFFVIFAIRVVLTAQTTTKALLQSDTEENIYFHDFIGPFLRYYV